MPCILINTIFREEKNSFCLEILKLPFFDNDVLISFILLCFAEIIVVLNFMPVVQFLESRQYLGVFIFLVISVFYRLRSGLSESIWNYSIFKKKSL